MQKVTLGITRSGQPGLFTKRMLARNITRDQYDEAMADAEFAVKLAARCHFQFVPTHEETF